MGEIDHNYYKGSLRITSPCCEAVLGLGLALVPDYPRSGLCSQIVTLYYQSTLEASGQKLGAHKFWNAS